MRRLRMSMLAASAALPGCALQMPSERVDPVVAGEVFASAADQVSRCYHSPRIASAGKQIATRIGVRLNADGSLAELPVVLGQTGVTETNRAYAAAMAQAAALAVIRCAPLRLPSQHYSDVWSIFELRFSPRRSV